MDQWAQRAANHQLYAPSQELLEVSDQASRKPRCCRTGNVDKEVHIAFEHVFPASHRAEKPDIARAVPRGHPQDFVAMLPYALTGAHSSTIVSSGQQNGIDEASDLPNPEIRRVRTYGSRQFGARKSCHLRPKGSVEN